MAVDAFGMPRFAAGSQQQADAGQHYANQQQPPANAYQQLNQQQQYENARWFENLSSLGHQDARENPYASGLGQEDVIRRINQSPWRGANFGQNHPTPNRPQPITGWRAVFGLCADLAAVNAAYHRLAQSAHPDHGGSTERMVALTAARDAARKELTR